MGGRAAGLGSWQMGGRAAGLGSWQMGGRASGQGCVLGTPNPV